MAFVVEAGDVVSRLSVRVLVRQMLAAQWRWATVTGAGPLVIRFDGEDDPVEATPDTLVSGLQVGDRVRVEITNRRLVIHGKAY